MRTTNKAAALPALLVLLVLLVLQLTPTPASAQAVSNPYDYTRTSAFTYDSSGLLQTETVEPDLAQQCFTTTYTHDGRGNKNSASTAGCTSTTGLWQFTSRKTLSVANGVPAVSSPAIPAGTTMTVLVNGVSVTVPTGTFIRTGINDLGHTEVRDLDPRNGALTKLTGPNGIDSTWTLDAFGRVELEVRADATRVRTHYCYFNIAEISANSAGCSSIFATAPPAEVPAQSVYAVQTQQVNSAGTAVGAYSRVYYDKAGRKIRVATPSFDGARSIVQDTDYNEFGAVAIVTQPYFADSGRSVVATGSADYGMTQTQYDTLSRPILVYTIDPVGSQNGSGGNAKVAYGSRRGASTSTKTAVTYAGLSTTTVSEGLTRSELKNPEGRLVRTTDTYGAQVLHQHDAFGNLIYTRDALQKTTTISYDIRGRKLILADADTGHTTYCHDALGQLKAQQTAKQRGVPFTTYQCPSASGAGSTAPVISGWSSYGYDTLGRMTQRAEPGDYTTTWTYDAYVGGGSCNKGKGKLCEVRTDHGVQRRHAYDNNGRPQSTRLDATSGSALVAASAVSYDTNGRVDSQTYPTGLKLTYAYNAQGYLASASTATAFTVSGKTIAANTVLWQAQSVNAWGRAETESMPSTDSANPLRNWASFEPATGRLASQKSGTNQTTPAGVNLSYTWNSRNLLTARADLIGFNSVATNDSFVHDDLGRLTQYQASGHNGTQTVSRTVNLSYNAAGMLLNKSDVGSYSYIGSPLGQVHALQSITSTGDQQYNASFSYDRSGNLVTQGGNGAKNGATYVQPKYTAIGYTSFNMVASINSDAGSSGTSGRPYYTYQYDDNHQRLQETRKRDGVIRTTWYLHPDNQGGLGFEREQGAANANRHYLSAAGQVFAVLVTSDALPAIGNSLAPPSSGVTVTAVKLEYWHRDHLGTLVATSNQVGANTGRFAYDPFGKRRQLSTSYDPFGSIVVDWSTGPDRGFTGHEHLDDVGIVNMNGRVFDPLVARFMQADPLVVDPYDLQAFDRYGYCFNGPGNCVDPSGYSAWTRFRGFAIRAGAAALDGMGCAGWCSAAVGAYEGYEVGGNRGAIFGAISAYAGYQIGLSDSGPAVRGFFAAASGCLGAEVAGGKCTQGAVAGLGMFVGQELVKYYLPSADPTKSCIVANCVSPDYTVSEAGDGPSSFCVDFDFHLAKWWWGPVGMWAGRYPELSTCPQGGVVGVGRSMTASLVEDPDGR